MRLKISNSLKDKREWNCFDLKQTGFKNEQKRPLLKSGRFDLKANSITLLEGF
jgi:hypothetical protein